MVFENISDGGLCAAAQVVDSGNLPSGNAVLDVCKSINLPAPTVALCAFDAGTD